MSVATKIKNYDIILEAKNGSEDAMEQVIKKYEKLVYDTVNKITTDDYARQDLYQVGFIGLIEAVGKFDLDSGYEFMTFLYMRVRGAVFNHLRDNHVMKVPNKIKYISTKMKKRGLTHEPVSYISEVLGESEEDVLEAITYLQISRMKSTTETIHKSNSGLGNDITVEDSMVGDLNGNTWEDSIFLRGLITKLPKKQRFVVTERFFHDRTLEDIGKDLNVDYRVITRVERKALDNLRELMNGRGLKPETRGGSQKPTKGNQELAKELTRKGELKQIEISRLTGVPSGTIAYWTSKLRKGDKI